MLAPAAPAAAEQTFRTYDAALGTLPEQQGWTFAQSGGSPPAPTVSGGFLNQGPTSTPGTQVWSDTLNLTQYAPRDFTQGTFVLTARLDVLSSSFFNDGSLRRAGYYFSVSDALGRYFYLAVAGDRVWLDRDPNAPSGGPAAVLFNTTGVHDYELRIDATGARTFIDGNLVTSAALGAGGQQAANTVIFGDLSVLGASQTRLANVQYTAVAVPEPGTAAHLLLPLTGLFGACIRRRHTTKGVPA
jgi:hypothetical protein